MSSHHFVREGQEPALLIINALSQELAAPLLEWAPHVVVVDDALPEIISWGIKIDFVLAAAGTEMLLADKLQHQHPVEIVLYKSSENPLKAGIEVLKSHHNAAVNVMIADARSAMALPEVRTFPVTLLTGNVRWSMIDKGRYEKWLPQNTVLRVVCENPESLSISGMEFSADSYRAENDGLVTIKSPQEFWVGEFL
jgi:hypothetical protein